MRTGILGASKEEVEHILEDLKESSRETIGSRDYFAGSLYGQDVVLNISGWGKVASASAATAMILRFEVDSIIFCGLCGGASAELNIGDIIIGSKFVQHDIDAQPIFAKYQVPPLGISCFKMGPDFKKEPTYFKADPVLQKAAFQAAQNFVTNNINEDIPTDLLKQFNIIKPGICEGLIATGDQFIRSAEKMNELQSELPGLKGVEMEGAAVAQVCAHHAVPFACIRIVSDKADHSAVIDFAAFIKEIASYFTRGIVRNMLNHL
ncbi:MAG: 5'-methylthioadenosine/adenosylhomocysteine nucleosidase [Sedimentisphaerales bacterium]|nr:5'-methylthioadenosine/adenosylhomocysteine nucleosidase [Sedimentisphaerales bacterium]